MVGDYTNQESVCPRLLRYGGRRGLRMNEAGANGVPEIWELRCRQGRVASQRGADTTSV